mmetsp:Transcript_10325/g.31947  ORF Transcript_10325/g.31947 Transcript_10325/m.31947 type:complete len:311 (-) Transcript_10325:349-1281(-)
MDEAARVLRRRLERAQRRGLRRRHVVGGEVRVDVVDGEEAIDGVHQRALRAAAALAAEDDVRGVNLDAVGEHLDGGAHQGDAHLAPVHLVVHLPPHRADDVLHVVQARVRVRQEVVDRGGLLLRGRLRVDLGAEAEHARGDVLRRGFDRDVHADEPALGLRPVDGQVGVDVVDRRRLRRVAEVPIADHERVVRERQRAPAALAHLDERAADAARDVRAEVTRDRVHVLLAEERERRVRVGDVGQRHRRDRGLDRARDVLALSRVQLLEGAAVQVGVARRLEHLREGAEAVPYGVLRQRALARLLEETVLP